MVIRVRPTPSPALLKVPEATIAQLARRFLVDPFSASTGPDLSGLSAEGLDALARLAESLEVPAKELMESTGELRSRAVELLVDVLKRASLESARGKAAKESLGDAGLLPSGQYSIQFNDLLTQFEDLGERKVHILEVMQAPHSVQHVASENDEDNVEGQSLFARSISPPKSPEFLQLVIAHRKGSVLSFAGAWRIYSELVDWNSSKTLIDILSSFVSVYGISFSIGNSQPQLFVEYKTFDVPPDFRQNAGTAIRILTSPENKDHDFMASISLRMTSDRKAAVALGYVIDTTRYREDIQRVGRR